MAYRPFSQQLIGFGSGRLTFANPSRLQGRANQLSDKLTDILAVETAAPFPRPSLTDLLGLGSRWVASCTDARAGARQGTKPT
jgi:hypothetical protein